MHLWPHALPGNADSRAISPHFYHRKGVQPNSYAGYTNLNCGWFDGHTGFANDPYPNSSRSNRYAITHRTCGCTGPDEELGSTYLTCGHTAARRASDPDRSAQVGDRADYYKHQGGRADNHDG